MGETARRGQREQSRVRPCVAGAVVVLTLVGCSGGSRTKTVAGPTVTAIVTETATVTDSATPLVSAPSTTIASSGPSYPAGYPKIIDVATVPQPVRDYLDSQHESKAVAVAPGVWAELTTGASMQDALATGTLTGFCASIKAYERKYTGGQEHGGLCW